MDGGRTTERQYSEYFEFCFYITRTRVRSRYIPTSVGVDEERRKEFLDKQCNPMYFQGVRTIRKSDSTGPQRFGQPWPDGPDVGGLHRFDGTGCWQQHLLVFHAITKSNR